MMRLIFISFLLLLSFASSQKLCGSIRLKNAGLLSVYQNKKALNNSEKYSILASTYNSKTNTVDDAFVIDRPGLLLNDSLSNVQLFPFDKPYNWPKELKQLDDFSVETVLIADGADIKGKIKGHVYLANVTDMKKIISYDITSPRVPEVKLAYHYSDALFKRISFAGGKDILTCRSVFVSGEYNNSELVYLKRPDLGNEFLRPWKDNVLLSNACDSKLLELQFSESLLKKWDVVYAVGSYTKQLNIIWSESMNGSAGNWDDPSHIKLLTLDKSRHFYDIVIADVNNDKKLDIIVSVVSNVKGSVEMWEIPDNDFRLVDNYTKHVLDDSYVPRGGQLNRAPGVIHVHHPTSNKAGKPWIFVAGGDDGRVYYYVPLSQDKKNWKYTRNILDDYGPNQTVSGLTVVDLDGDGVVELLVSLNVQGLVKVYSMAHS